MKRSLVLFATFLAGTLMATQSWAISAKKYQDKIAHYAYSYPTPPTSALNFEPGADAAKVITEQEGKRKIASSATSDEWYEAKMSSEFKQIRQMIMQIKTGEELDQKLGDLDYNFANLKETDSQFFVAQIIPLRAMRGLVWRLRPLVEKTKLAHSILLTSVKNIFIGANLFFPSNQTEALTQYLTRPFVENGVAPWLRKGETVQGFSSPADGGEAQLQAHFQTVVIPMLETAADRITKIHFSGDWRVFDNRIWYGGETFPDALDRYTLVGEVERYAALSSLYAGISALSYETAYSWNTALDLNIALAHLYGWDSALFNTVEGAPLASRVAVMNKSQFAQWGVLINPEMMSKAWTNLQSSVTAAEYAWKGMKSRPVSEYTMVDNSMALPFQRPINTRFEGMKAMIEGHSTAVSRITKDHISVNLPAFFAHPPKNLRELYPIHFVQGQQFIDVQLQTSSGPKKMNYRNYMIGSGDHWNITGDSPYLKLFPDLKTDEDLKKGLRILSQNWGTSLTVSPLVDYIY